jgi:hypothetical protein
MTAIIPVGRAPRVIRKGDKMPQTTKTKGAGAFAKAVAPTKAPTPAAKSGRISNLGEWAHPPKGKKKG